MTGRNSGGPAAPSRRLVCLTAALFAFSGGCALPRADDRIAARALRTDVLLGAPPLPPPPAPPTADEPLAGAAGPLAPLERIPPRHPERGAEFRREAPRSAEGPQTGSLPEASSAEDASGGHRASTDPPLICPAPGSSVEVPLALKAPGPPAKDQIYRFMNRGEVRTTGAPQRLPPVSNRSVAAWHSIPDPVYTSLYRVTLTSNLVHGPADYFAGSGTNLTVLSYDLVLDVAVPAPALEGLYLRQIVTEDHNGVRESFTPEPPLKLYQVPRDWGERPVWATAGFDALSQTAMGFQARVAGRELLNACGTLIEGWKVDLSNGRSTGPARELSFEGSLVFAPQYGLIVKDRVQIGGRLAGVAVESSYTSTIADPPKAASAPG